MRKIILTVFVLTVVVNCYSQEILKDANRIVLKTEMSKNENFQTVIDFLLDKGFELEDYDKEIGVITTRCARMQGLSPCYYLYFVCNDKTIKVTGRARLTENDPGLQLENGGMKGSPGWKAFQEMDKYSRMLKNEGIVYEKI